MRSVSIIILNAFLAQAIANEDNLSNLLDRLLDGNNVDFDGTTLGKTHPDMAPATMSRVQPFVPQAVGVAAEKLRRYGINPGPLETFAMTAIDANNKGTGMRNVAALASSMPVNVRAELSKLGKDVVVKAEAMKKEDMAGITAPMGFWDPWGISTNCGEDQLIFYREAELKHGRFGMLASLGIIAGEAFGPLFGAAPDTPAAKMFLAATPAPYEKFWGAVIVATGFAELFALNSQQWGSYSLPGDVGFDPLGLKPKSEAEFKQIQNKELNNGRLAMLAAAGIIAQEMVTGQKIFR